MKIWHINKRRNTLAINICSKYLTGHHGLEHHVVTLDVTNRCPPTASTRRSTPYCGSLEGSSTTRLWVINPTTNTSNPPFFPAMGIQHVNIQVPHMRKGMITHQTPCHPAKIRTLFVRISIAIRLVL